MLHPNAYLQTSASPLSILLASTFKGGLFLAKPRSHGEALEGLKALKRTPPPRPQLRGSRTQGDSTVRLVSPTPRLNRLEEHLPIQKHQGFKPPLNLNGGSSNHHCDERKRKEMDPFFSVHFFIRHILTNMKTKYVPKVSSKLGPLGPFFFMAARNPRDVLSPARQSEPLRGWLCPTGRPLLFFFCGTMVIVGNTLYIFAYCGLVVEIQPLNCQNLMVCSLSNVNQGTVLHGCYSKCFLSVYV